MNLRCTYCQTPFSVSRLEKLAALQRMHAENLHHYDVFCPRCRKANSVSRQRLEIFTPGWQEGLKTLEAEAAQIEKVRTEPGSISAAPKPVAAPAEASRNRHASRAAKTAAKAAPVKAKPAAKKAAARAKPAARSTTKKSSAKPAAKKAASKAKPAAKKAVKKKK